MNRLGRKRTVLLSMLITLLAMLLLIIPGKVMWCYLSFALLGIGNTILQVSLNPLLTDVVKGGQLTSSLTAGQFIKAISSFCGPLIAGWATVGLGSWHYMFPVFAVITVCSTVWLMCTPVTEARQAEKSASFASSFGLLKDKTILLLFLGIVFVVGVDVGINTVTPKLLVERCGLSVADAGWGTSCYFLFRTVGAFCGAFILAKFLPYKFFAATMFAGILAMLDLLFFAQDYFHILAMIAVMGLCIANVFSIIFSLALQHVPGKANEISGLMIMGVSGGAVIPPLMGVLTTVVGSQTGSLAIILGGVAYLCWCSLKVSLRKQ